MSLRRRIVEDPIIGLHIDAFEETRLGIGIGIGKGTRSIDIGGFDDHQAAIRLAIRIQKRAGDLQRAFGIQLVEMLQMRGRVSMRTFRWPGLSLQIKANSIVFSSCRPVTIQW